MSYQHPTVDKARWQFFNVAHNQLKEVVVIKSCWLRRLVYAGLNLSERCKTFLTVFDEVFFIFWLSLSTGGRPADLIHKSASSNCLHWRQDWKPRAEQKQNKEKKRSILFLSNTVLLKPGRDKSERSKCFSQHNPNLSPHSYCRWIFYQLERLGRQEEPEKMYSVTQSTIFSSYELQDPFQWSSRISV